MKDLKRVPYTNGVDNEIKGYVDLTDIVEEALKDIKKNGRNRKKRSKK